MKKERFALTGILHWLFTAAATVVFILMLSNGAFAAEPAVRSATAAETDQTCWNTYGIPTSEMQITVNEGTFSEDNTNIAKVFDRNLSTWWKSSPANDCGYTVGGVYYAQYNNHIDVTFSQSVTIDRILYMPASDSGYAKGYAKIMNIYLDDDEEGSFEDPFIFTSNESLNMMCFDFGESLTCKRIRLEWELTPSGHYWNATAAEIIFMQPQIADLDGMFTDYTRTALNPGYNQTKIDEIRESLKSNINYETQFKSLLDRADDVLSGKIKFEASRLFTTDPEKDGGQQLYQYGDRRNYTQSQLGISWFGIDKQTLGLSGTAGETITVYVEADEGAKLPNLNFTQYFGSWKGWQQEVSLQRGINIITVPDINSGLCTYPVQQQAGGPFYLENPYTEETQGGNVKVYIEGGDTYPVFHLNDDESDFYESLTNYASQFSGNYTAGDTAYYYQDGIGYNLIEMESDHTLITVQATNTYNVLIGGGLSAQTSMTNWDILIEKLMEYGGIPATEESQYAEYWDERNVHLGINIKLAQKYGAAYGAYEQVGIFTDDWISGAIYCDGKEGWGMIHEIGHCLDMGDMIVSECSNNMYSKYFESVEFSDGTRGYFAEDLSNLTSDRIDHTASSYFDTNRYNYLVWFHLEGYHPGFWGEMANLYRYDTSGTSGLNATEKHIYLASRVMKMDMRYYYERFGYRQNTNDAVFTCAGQTETLNTAMQALIDSGEISSTEKLPFWYLDSQQYRLKTGDSLTEGGIYNQNDANFKAVIRSIEKTDSGYSLLLGGAADSVDHLGYEILEGNDTKGWQVIGFTASALFEDTTDYTDTAVYGENYTPSYKLRLVDRALNYSADSEIKQLADNEDAVCSINDTTYHAIADAVTAASAGDTIILLQDHIETGIVIDKNLTIKGLDSAEVPLVLSKGSSGSIFTVTNNAELMIEGDKMILDGNHFEQSGALITADSGKVVLNHLEMRNNLIADGNSSFGGAIHAKASGACSLILNNCSIHDCRAGYGGAIALSTAKNTMTIKNSDLYNNTATGSGGGISCKGAVYMYGSRIYNNTAASGGGGLYIYDGGILGCNMTYNQTDIDLSDASTNYIYSNTARDGGGIFQNGNTKITNTVLEKNHATANGGGVYSNATGGNHRSFYSYEGTIVRDNTAVHTGSQLYSKCSSGAGPKLKDTVVTASCVANQNLLHEESGTEGVFEYLGTTKVTEVHDPAQITHVSAVVRTCLQDGCKEHYHCANCERNFEDEGCTVELSEVLLPAYGGDHEWNLGDVIRAATEEEAGEMCFTCTKCGETKTEVIPAYKRGDMDGDKDVDLDDAGIAKSIAIKTISPTLQQRMAGDLDGNGIITINEARKIKRAALGQISLSN